MPAEPTSGQDHDRDQEQLIGQLRHSMTVDICSDDFMPIQNRSGGPDTGPPPLVSILSKAVS